MFLHSGASLHGHEYSNRPAAAGQQNNIRRSPLLRSAFAAPKPRPVSFDGAKPPVTTQPRRPFSDFVPRLPEPVVRFVEPEDKEPPPTPVPEDAASVMSSSELSDGSAPESATGTTSSTTRRRRRSASSRASTKAATRYAVAVPPPRFAGKTRVVRKLAPKLYLQLMETSPDKRPKPVIDVFPSSRIAGPVIAPRLAKRFPGILGPKGELGSADVVLLQSEDYDTVSEDVDSEDEEGRLDHRHPIAVLSPVKKSDQTEIVLDDGSVWVAQPLPKGSFEFVRTDDHGNATTARWVRRPNSKTKTSDAAESSSQAGRGTPETPEAKYTFSIINPNSRRHPVMATLTREYLHIQDAYTSVSTSSSKYPPSRPLSRSLSVTVAQQQPAHRTPTTPVLARSVSTSATEWESDARHVQTPELESGRTTHPVDEATKVLISVTAVFVALESNWSPFYRSHTYHTETPIAESSSTLSPVPDTPSKSCKTGRNRRNSSDTHHSDTVAPHSRDHSPVRPAWWETTSFPAGQPRPQTPSRPGPRRATSTGAAFMQRARIASAQAAESSDSEHQHQPTKRRPRLLSVGDRGTRKDTQRPAVGNRHSMPATLPVHSEVMLGEAMDKVVVTVGKEGVQATAPSRESRGAAPRHSHSGRKVQSAYYPAALPMVAVRSDDSGIELGAVKPGQVTLRPTGTYTPAVLGNEGRRGAEKGFSGKMRSLGQWFRRLGHTHTH